MAVKLAIWNSALREIGDGKLSDTGEPEKKARLLADVFSDVVGDCLEAGQWNFAIRSVEVEADTGLAPAFGFTYGFAKPDDWVRTTALSDDPQRYVGLDRYDDKGNTWEADVDTIYVNYVSDSGDYGLNLSRWPRSFARFVELSLAQRVVEDLTQNASKKEELDKDVKDALAIAKSRDAIADAQPRYPPLGSWNSSRSGSTRDRGSRTRLIG